MAKLRYWLPTLFWMGLVFFVSSRPALQAASVNWLDFGIKKTAHFIEYFILACLLFRSLKNTTHLDLKNLLLFTFIITVLYAASDEWHQTFILGREGRIRDVAIDALGAASACLYLLRSKRIHTTG